MISPPVSGPVLSSPVSGTSFAGRWTYIADRGVSCTAVNLAAASGEFGFVLLYLYGVTLRVNCKRVSASFLLDVRVAPYMWVVCIVLVLLYISAVAVCFCDVILCIFVSTI